MACSAHTLVFNGNEARRLERDSQPTIKRERFERLERASKATSKRATTGVTARGRLEKKKRCSLTLGGNPPSFVME